MCWDMVGGRLKGDRLREQLEQGREEKGKWNHVVL